jgi:hypothetical protein
MTRDDILRLAREAGGTLSSFDRWSMHTSDVVRFAALVAAAEREACASILDRNAEVCGTDSIVRDVLASNALAIRARGDA